VGVVVGEPGEVGEVVAPGAVMGAVLVAVGSVEVLISVPGWFLVWIGALRAGCLMWLALSEMERQEKEG
jgi:hypothetical protein